MKFLVSVILMFSVSGFCQMVVASDDLGQINTQIKNSILKIAEKSGDMEAELLKKTSDSMMLSIQKTFLVSLEQILPQKYIGANDLELSPSDYLGSGSLIGETDDVVKNIEQDAVKKALPLIFFAMRKVSSHIEKHQSPGKLSESECRKIYKTALTDVTNYFVIFSGSYLESAKAVL